MLSVCSFVAWSRPSETLVLSRKATTSQVRFMRIAIRLLTNQAEETTRVQKVHSRILLYLSYSGCSRKADLRTIAIGLVWIVSYSDIFVTPKLGKIRKSGIFRKIGDFSKRGKNPCFGKKLFWRTLENPPKTPKNPQKPPILDVHKISKKGAFFEKNRSFWC